MEKNEIYDIKITDMTEDGAGIGHIDGMAVFVKDSAVGDEARIKIIKVKKTYAYGRIETLISPSKDRVEPACPVARQCGGCTLQHLSYYAELELKKNRVLSCLGRLGGIENPEDYLEGVYGMTDTSGVSEASDNSDMKYRGLSGDSFQVKRYRNKMQFPVGLDKEGKVNVGFYAGRTHSIIPINDCMNGHEINQYIIKAFKEWADKYKISVYDEKSGKGLLRHLITRVGFRTGEVMVCLVLNGKKLPHSLEFVEAMKEAINAYKTSRAGVHQDENSNLINDIDYSLGSVVININCENTNKILGDDTFTLFGQDYITDYIGDIGFKISAQSFYQVNPVQTEKLYSKALEYAGLTGEETVWDMYSGIGTISLFLAQKAKKVYGVEIVPQAIENARQNAAFNNIDNTEFFTGQAETVVPELYESKDKYIADVVVVDPPRKGCDEKLLETLIKMSPKRLVYVSCNPATLARDLKILLTDGYKLDKISIYDQFCRSFHVETVVQLSKITGR